MGPETVNRNKDSNFYGPYAGRDQYIIMLEDNEREFVVTHNANIKSVSYFTGRETELQDLRQRVEEGRKSVLVSGMGGIGKTHICRKLFEEYLKKHADGADGSFQHIGYVEYSGDMNNDLKNCLKYKQQGNPEADKEAAWKELGYLASGGKLLLFVDNVDKPMREDPGLERLKSIPGAIILTSRRTAFSKEFELYMIGFLNTGQCREIYEKIRFVGSGIKIKDEELSDLEYIIEKLAARHTITIEFLASLARTKRWSVGRLKEELEKNGFKLEYKNEEDELVNIQESYETLYKLSELTEAEQNILEAFSVFPYIPLSAETCNQWLLSDAGVNEDDDILMGLYKKGWLQFDWEQESYAMHPVYAQFICEKCKPRLEKHIGLIKACQNCLEIPDSGLVSECQEFIPFAENIVKKAVLGMGMEHAKFINVFAYLLQNMAEYDKAITLYEKSLEIYKDILEEEHPTIATNYNDLAGVYVRQGEYDKAENLYKKGLEIQEKVLGENNFYTTCIYSNIAYIYRRQGKYEQARELIEKCVKIREHLFGKDHIETVKSYYGLAEVLRKQKNYDQAERLLNISLEIQKNNLKQNHPDIGSTYSSLASLYAETGRYEEAVKLFSKSLDIQTIALGEIHPKIAVIYCNIAFVYEKMEDYKKSLDYNFKGYKILALKVAPSHPDYLVADRNLKRRYIKCNPEGDFEQWLDNKMHEEE